ncbi:MAG: hypothetical protein GC162_19230 [Planctomycetes bacterium]|nr:hypothetical protein [Planctomycetota bacterium]
MPRSNRIICACLALAMVLGLGAVAPARAALIVTSDFNPNLNGSGTFTIGNKIQIGASAITINALGVQDTGANGIIANTKVGLWTTGGTLLASVTVPSGAGSTLIDDYRYVLLGFSITLTANTQYIIGAESATNGTKENAGDGFSVGGYYSGGTGVTLVDSRFIAGSLAMPTTTATPTARWGPGNATLIIPAPAALPAGAALLILSNLRRRTTRLTAGDRRA